MSDAGENQLRPRIEQAFETSLGGFLRAEPSIEIEVFDGSEVHLRRASGILAVLVDVGVGEDAIQPSLSFEEIARSLPKLAEGGGIAGASAGETFGTLSVMAQQFASGDTAK